MENIQSGTLENHQPNKAMQLGQHHKTYLFESETKRLKVYFIEHPEQLVDRKILFNNSVAIVRYFGGLKHEGKPINSQNQHWVGVEWDEDDRGKHNGTVNGYTYFSCPDKKGSLLKYEKIQFGYKLQIGLFKRYFRIEELHHAKTLYDNLKSHQKQQTIQTTQKHTEGKKIHKVQYDTEAYVQTLKKSKKIMIQFIGFDQVWAKINNLEKIQSISLAQCKICDLGVQGNLRDLLPNLKILSLEDNLLTSWDQIFQLGLQLRFLNELSVAYNHLAMPEKNFEDMTHINILGNGKTIAIPETKIFPELKCLILIKTNLSWKTLFKVFKAFDGIQQLILCRNNLSDVQNINLEKILKYMGDLNFLNLEQCNLSSVDFLHPFSNLEKLQKLTLNKNQIKQFGRKISGFLSLRSLSIEHNLIEHPVVLYEISSFKNLQGLNVKHNPVSQRMGNSYVRMRAVAQLPKLKIINGALLKKYERKDCEIYYLRESFREYFALKKVPDYNYDYEDFLKYCDEWHPNIPILIKRYGNPYQVQKKKQIQEIIKQQVKTTELNKGTGMINVFIEIKQTSLIEKRKLPLTWTLSSLKNFIARANKIPAGMQRLTYKIQEASNQQQMQDDHKPLHYYNLKVDSRIYVEKIA